MHKSNQYRDPPPSLDDVAVQRIPPPSPPPFSDDSGDHTPAPPAQISSLRRRINSLASCCSQEKLTKDMNRSIVSFNLTTEEFVIKILGLEKFYSNSSCSLLNLNGTLGVVMSGNQNYIKKEYCFEILGLCGDADNNNEETTTKLVNKFCIKLSSPSIKIVGILKARHILIRNEDEEKPHFSYDMETGITTQFPELADASTLGCQQGSLIRPSDLARLGNSV